jgi:methylase of polypeptide subunit release factors
VSVIRLPHFQLILDVPDGIDMPRSELLDALTFDLPVAPDQTVLDLGCGAGLYTLLALRAGCRVLATDVDARAIEVTKRNVRDNGLDTHRVGYAVGDLFDAVPRGATFDLIVANLPQTPCSPELRMAPGFRQSKWAGADGLEYINRLLVGLERYVKPAGALMMLQIGWLDWPIIDASLQALGFESNVLQTAHRRFTWSEYANYAPNLPELLRLRISSGSAQPLAKTADNEQLAFPVRWVAYRRSASAA